MIEKERVSILCYTRVRQTLNYTGIIGNAYAPHSRASGAINTSTTLCCRWLCGVCKRRQSQRMKWGGGGGIRTNVHASDSIRIWRARGGAVQSEPISAQDRFNDSAIARRRHAVLHTDSLLSLSLSLCSPGWFDFCCWSLRYATTTYNTS